VSTNTTPQPMPATAPKRNGRLTGVPSILSADVVVRGTLISAGDVQVDGKIEGDIRAAGLVVGEKAVIAGDVYAEEATVRGRVEGSISARKVQLAATCHVVGNVLHESLSVESGAFFEGNCRHSDNPLVDAPEATPPAKHAPAPAPHAELRKPAAGHSAHAPAASAAPMAAKPSGDDHSARPAASFSPLKN
jgi:cytoskeletal protein CcmA (bactofilin family)